MRHFRKDLAAFLALACMAASPALSHDDRPEGQFGTGRGRPSGPNIVDARGRIVGLAFSPGVALRQSQGAWFKLDMYFHGISWKDRVLLAYPSTNCSGPAYMSLAGVPAWSTFLAAATQPTPGYVTDGVVYFPGPPYAKKRMLSQRWVTTASPGVCELIPYESNGVVGVALTEKLTGFVGPFQTK